MANVLYPKFKQALLSPGLDLSTLALRAVLIDTATYAYSGTHEFLSSVPAGARIGAPQLLASKTVTNGVFDAADITFPTVTGASVEALLLYVDTGADDTSRLLVFVDAATGLPVTPSGGNIGITFAAGGIFNL